MDKYRLIYSEDGIEVIIKDRIERGRRPTVTVFREENVRAVRGRTPEYRRIDRTGLREYTTLRLPG